MKLRAYVIRLSDHVLSSDLATQAFNAAERLGYAAHFFEGLQHKADIARAFQAHRLVAHPDGGDIQTNWGTMGCFISHFLLWQKAIELNQPIVILEHDGLPLVNCITLIDQVEHVCHLDRFLPLSTQCDPAEYFDYYNHKVSIVNGSGVGPYAYAGCFYKGSNVTGSFFRGAYGYIITPTGAQRVIDFVQKHGAFPADMCLCENAVKLQGSNSTHVRLNPFFHNVDMQRQYTTRR